MRDLIVLTWGFASIPISFIRPFYGLCVFSILAYNRTQDLTWGVAADYRLSFYIAVATLAGYVIRPPRGKYVVFEARTWVLILLLGLVTISVFTATYPHLSFHKFYEFIKVMIVAMITPALLYSKERMRAIFWVIGLSLGFYGVKNGLLFEEARQGPGGMLLDNNDFSAALVMNIPFLLALGRTEVNKWYKRGFFMAVPLTMIAVAMTHSRGGFLALVLVYCVIIWKSKHRMTAILAAPFIVVIFWFAMPPEFIERISTLKNPTEDNSAQARLDAWQTAFRMSEQHPWKGVGYRNFQAVYNDFALERDARNRVAHNSYLQLMAESGRPSLLVFLLLLAMTVMNCWKVQRLGRARFGKDHWFVVYAGAIEIAIYGYAASGMFLNRAHFDLLYHIISISIALNLLAKRELREAALEARKEKEAELESGGFNYGAGALGTG